MLPTHLPDPADAPSRHHASGVPAPSGGEAGRIRLVEVDSLRPGMFICDFNAGWMAHPFLSNQLLLASRTEIKKIKKCGIDSVYIDTFRGIDPGAGRLLDEVVDEACSEMRQLASPIPAVADGVSSHTPVPRSERMKMARAVVEQASVRLRKAMSDARLGNAVDVPALRDAVRQICHSVVHNSDAMALVCQLRKSDEYTLSHSVNVSILLARFSQHLGHAPERSFEIALGGLLHDIGKAKVRSAVLKKPGKLTDAEFEHMKTHVALGSEMMSGYPFPPGAMAVLAEHHERDDGSGYPAGSAGKAISEAGRMAAIADVYDAISSDRVYHKGIPAPEAIRRIFTWKRHFDVDLVQSFVRCMGIYPVGSLVRLKSNRLAVVLEHHSDALMRPRVRCIYHATQRMPIKPLEINLAARHWLDREEIVGHESPDDWWLDLGRHLED